MLDRPTRTGNRTIAIDMTIAVAMFLIAFVLAQAFDLAEVWENWADRHENWELDELPLALSMAAVALLWFSWRRWCALAKEFRRSKRIMRRLRSSLEQRRATERRLIEARQQAELADRAKSEFLANISHELRTPLNAIIGFSDVIVNEVDGPIGNPTYHEYAGDIRDSGRHLLGIINEILDLSKVEAGQAELREEALAPADIIQSAMRLVSMQSAASGIDLRFDQNAAGLEFFGDPRLMKQILINLISNAVKFSTASGSVTVTTDVAVTGGLEIRIADNGLGMTREEVAIALKPFRQIENAYSRSRPGTGLGLPLAVALTELHGGSLVVESQPGRGTEVLLEFPAERSLRPSESVLDAQVAG
ncbi:sensor histidine kinase [Pelagibius litoralis]|nr:ATP-binding protein [Pelagibius litoralis]